MTEEEIARIRMTLVHAENELGIAENSLGIAKRKFEKARNKLNKAENRASIVEGVIDTLQTQLKAAKHEP